MLGGTGRPKEGVVVVLCGKEVELQQVRPGRVSGRGSGMGDLARSWRLGRLQRSEPLGGQVAQLGLSGAGISELGRG